MINKLMVIGAHPDDCELIAGGLTAKIKKEVPGSEVCYLTTTNGDAGHQTLYGERLAKIRYNEARKVADTLGVSYIVMDNHDGRLTTDIDIREKLIGEIRKFSPDVIITHFPDDYHPDHRNTSTLARDSIYLLGVPAICPEIPVMKKMPALLYELAGCTESAVFCDIKNYITDKAKASVCNESQYFDWLPWIDGDDISSVDGSDESKLKYMTAKMKKFAENTYYQYKESADKFFKNATDSIEAFGICRYAGDLDKDFIEFFKNN